MSSKEELLNEIKVLSNSIRKKNLALKVGLIARDKFLEDTFKPIVDPLNKIKNTLAKSSTLSQGELEINKPFIKETETTETESISKSSGDITEDDEEEQHSEKEEEEGEQELDDLTTSESPTNISILSHEIGKKGPLSRKYILKMLHSAQRTTKYHVYGARLEKDGLQIGDSKLEVDDNDNITIKGQTFKGTAGLFELIFKPIPKKYSKNDLNTFKNICILTNSHRKGYSANTPIHRNRSEKYKEIIARLFSKSRGKHKKAKGKGMSMKSVYDTNVIYYNDVNKLVDRMRLLYESIQAGHTGLNNEMVALTEELKGRGYIT